MIRGADMVIDATHPFAVIVTDPEALGAANGGVVRNQATWGQMNGPDDIPTQGLENSSNIVEHPFSSPKPTITKQRIDGNDAKKRGDSVEFLITVENTGDMNMEGWTVKDTPPSSDSQTITNIADAEKVGFLKYESDDSAGAKAEDGTVSWSVDVAPHTKKEIKVKMSVTATKAGTYDNLATLTSPDGKISLEDRAQVNAIVPDTASAPTKSPTGGIAKDAIAQMGGTVAPVLGVLCFALSVMGMTIHGKRRR